jgi:hypothetical protein
MKPLLLAVTMFALSAPVAEAARFRGQTSQDRRAALITREGLAARITIFWRAECGQGRVVDDTSFLSPFKESTATFVRDGGPYVTRIHDDTGRSYRMHVNARVRAHRVTENKWRGRFRADAEVRRNGELVTRCHTGRIRWHATR